MNEIKIDETNKYDTVAIAKWIRQQFKKQLPDLKFSVRTELYSGGSSMSISVIESKKIRFLKRFDEISEHEILRFANARNDTVEEATEILKSRLNESYQQINQYHLKDDIYLTDEGKEALKHALQIINFHNWDNSDSMTDYFDVNYYVHLSLGNYDKPFIDGLYFPKKDLKLYYDGEDEWGREVWVDYETKKSYKKVDDKLYTITKSGEPDYHLDASKYNFFYDNFDSENNLVI